MLDRARDTEAADAPAMPPDRQGGGADTGRRLAALPDGHPSSPRYRQAELARHGREAVSEGRESAAADASRTDLAGRAASDTRRSMAGKPLSDTRRTDSPGNDGHGADHGSESGWLAPSVRDHPDRPEPAEVHLTADRARHILDGDAHNDLGGGHRHGTDRPRKTEFPADWSDDRIIASAEDVARSPDQAHWQSSNSRWRVDGERDGVRVFAVVLPDGRIWTAWPDRHSAGVTTNPAR